MKFERAVVSALENQGLICRYNAVSGRTRIRLDQQDQTAVWLALTDEGRCYGAAGDSSPIWLDGPEPESILKNLAFACDQRASRSEPKGASRMRRLGVLLWAAAVSL